jgi:DNA transformation protein and related proteins
MDRDFLIELFSGFGPVTLRRMFSGYGISADGVNFALALRAGVYLRADEVTIPQFEAEGSKPFQYQQRSTGKVVTVNSYWELPARLFDDQEELAGWARAALAAAERAALSKHSRRRKSAKDETPPTKEATSKPSTSKKSARMRRAQKKAAKPKAPAKRKSSASKTARRKRT